MIESSIITQQAADYLNSIAKSQADQAAALGRVGARAELLQWCNAWMTASAAWRKQSFESDWVTWQRNADGRYDPALARQKKDWQSKSFVDLTPSHRENIHAELFRLVAGSRPILEVTPRPGGDDEQAKNITDLELREFEKSRFEVEYNAIVEEKTTYGSGICRIWHEERVEDRIIREPILEQVNIGNPMSIMRRMQGKPQVLGYKPTKKPQVIYRGVRIQHIPLWDFFWDPKALQIKGSTVSVRSRISLQQLLDGVKRYGYMPEAAALLSQSASDDSVPGDKGMVQSERGISDAAPKREGNQKVWDYHHTWARLPQKWVYPLLKEPLPIDDAEGLVPARVIWHQQTVICVELNDDYDGEPPVHKDDYFPVAGRFIGRGIPEMLKNPQLVVNEVVNQRLDEGNLALQESVAVIEKALVNPEDLLGGGPGKVLRINQKAVGPNGDVRNAIFPLGRPDVKVNAGFVEVHEWERMAQERTSANRVTLGSQGLVNDSNKTLGGQMLLKETAGHKFAFIAMLSEFTFLYEVFRAYWKLIYKNVNAQELIDALGVERAAHFQLMSPEEVERSFRFEPKGIFEREAKAQMQARLRDLFDQFKGAPWIKDMAFFDEEAKSFDIDPERLKVPEAEAMAIMAKAQQMAAPMAQQMLNELVLKKAAQLVESDMASGLAGKAEGEKAEKPAKEPKA